MTVAAKKASKTLESLIDATAESHRPIVIKGALSNAVLLAESDWRAIEETLYLLSIPGMRASIRKGLKTPVSKCQTTLRW